MGELEHDAAASGQTPERKPAPSGRFLERPLGVVSLIAGVIGIVTGVVTLYLMFSGQDDESPPANGDQASEIQEFDGVAGHFAESRAILNFLDQNDGEVVYLDVGFPPILGPGSGDNLLVELVPTADGNNTPEIQQISVMTECGSSEANAEANPTVSDGCMGVALTFGQPQNPEAQTFFEHGVPRVKGYFRVDMTGGLYQGLRPISLEPLTFEEATSG